MFVVNKYFKLSKILTQLIPKTFIQFYKDYNCVPFWNDKINEISKTLFQPSTGNIKINKRKQKVFNKNKWFESEFNQEVGEHNEDILCIPTKNKNVIKKVIKIKLSLNAIQLQTIKRFMGVYRYFYNRTINYCNNIDKSTKTSYYLIDAKDDTTKVTVKCPTSWYNWIDLKKLLYQNQPEWVNEVHFDSHSCKQAIKEALKNIKTNIKKFKRTGKIFKMKLKSKKDVVSTMNIETQTISNKNTIFSNYVLNDKRIFKSMKTSEIFNKYDFCGSSISCHRTLNNVILNLVYKSKQKVNKNNKVCSIDPGVNNFATVYSDNEISKLGINCQEKISKVCKEMDIIQSRMNKESYYIIDKNGNKIEKTVNSNRKRNLKKAFHRKIQYIKNLKIELHNQVINYLTTTYSKIITSPFETQEMVCKLNSKVARMMNTLSFYSFKQKLKTKCEERNCILEIKPEYYTSMTCTNCGNIKYDLGSNKTYHCNKCDIIIERDYNGARNIMLRNNF